MRSFALAALSSLLLSSCYLSHEARSICRVSPLYAVDPTDTAALVPSGSLLVLDGTVFFTGTRSNVVGVFRVDDAGVLDVVGIVAGSAVGDGLAQVGTELYFPAQSPTWMLASVPLAGGTPTPRSSWVDAVVGDGTRLYGRSSPSTSVQWLDPSSMVGTTITLTGLTAITGANGRLAFATNVGSGHGRVETMSNFPTAQRMTLGELDVSVDALVSAPEGVLALAHGGVSVMPLDGRGARVAANGLVDARRIVAAPPGRAVVASSSRWTRVELSGGRRTEVLSDLATFGWDDASQMAADGDAIYFATPDGVFRADGCFD